MPRKSAKLHKPIKKVLKKLEKSSLLKNKVVLYLTLVATICVSLVYISKNNWDSLTTLIIVGVLTNYFTKNMTITLGISILVSLVVFNRNMRFMNVEGMEGGSNTVADNTTADEEAKANAEDAGDEEEDNVEGQENMKKNELKYCFVKDAETSKYVQHGKKKKIEETACKAVPKSCWALKSAECGKTGFSNKDVPASKPKRVDGGNDDDDEEGERIDYSKTLEMAYDNLQDVLGKDGIKGLTGETKRLINEQQNLMSSMKSIGPMMNQATGMMKTLKNMNLGGLKGLKNLKA